MNLSTTILLLLATIFDINNCISSPEWIDNVHIIFSNHLDVGFDGIGSLPPSIALTVINKYFDIYFPRAIEIAHNLTTIHNLTFSWMTQSWLIDLYFNCPAYFTLNNISLHCPNQTSMDHILNNGIKKGIIYWHAFPFNSQLEVYDSSLFEFGLTLSHRASKTYSAPISNTLSQRDVPGVTKSIIPILLNHNISAISIGVNGGSAPAAVPSIFKWKYDDNHTIITMIHPGGYGGLQLSDAVYINNFSHALVMAWNDDNAGPPPVAKALKWYNQTQYNFPNATTVFASSFTNYVNILKSSPQIYNALPVYQGEIGDSWNFGIQADPYKIAAHRIAQKYRAKCLRSGKCSLDDMNFYNFSRLLLKNGEHTFGGDTKKYLNAYHNFSAYYLWNNEDLREGLLVNNSVNNLTKFRATWYEQRWLGLENAVNALIVDSNNISNQIYVDLYNNITNDWSQLINVVSPLDGINGNQWELVNNASNVFHVKSAYNGRRYLIQFDVEHSGGIYRLVDMDNLMSYADSDNILGEFIYQTMNETDFDIYIDTFYYAWTSHTDYGKYKLNTFANYTKHQYIKTKFKNLYKLKNNSNEFLIEMDFGIYQENLTQFYGAMETVYNHINFNSERATFEMRLILINKTFTRIPECYYFKFLPLNCTNWMVDKIDRMVDIGDIIKNGSYHMHGVIGNTSCTINKTYEINFRSPHSGLVAFKPLYTNESSDFYDEFTGFPTPLLNASQNDGFVYVLGNNLWGTNYIEWYPFDVSNTNMTFLFEIDLPN